MKPMALVNMDVSGIVGYKTRVSEVVKYLEQWRILRGERVTDSTHSRSVDEVIFPPVFGITNRPFEDMQEHMSDPFTKRLFDSNWDMWFTSFNNLVLPQINQDRNTRRACLAFPHHCMVLMSFYARARTAFVYGYWRSLVTEKVPADMILFQHITNLFVAAADCDRGFATIQIGSYHKEIA